MQTLPKGPFISNLLDATVVSTSLLRGLANESKIAFERACCASLRPASSGERWALPAVLQSPSCMLYSKTCAISRRMGPALELC